MRKAWHRVPDTSRRRALLCVALCALVATSLSASRARVAAQGAGDDGFVTVDLPASREVRVENQRGGVTLEVWGEKYLAVAALSGDEPVSPAGDSPINLERGEDLLKITVARAVSTRPQTPTRRAATARGTQRGRAAARTASAAAPAFNLIVRVPAHARVSVVTSGGAVSVRGVPASLDVQTVSGEVRLSVAPTADASISVRTLYGAISVGAGVGADAGRTLRERYATRLGAGTNLIRLSTVRGGITLETSSEIADVRDDTRTPNAGAQSGRGNASRGAVKPPPPAATQREEPPAIIDEGMNNVTLGNTVTRQQVKSLPTPQPNAPTLDSGSSPASEERKHPPVLVGANGGGAAQSPSSKPTPPPGAPIEVNDDEVLTVETSVVTLNFSVVDRQSGRGLTNLIGGDFKVFEDGTEQQITHFEATNAPFDLLLLVDLSGSTAHVTDLIRASARRFVDSVRADDRVGVVAFAASPQVVSPLTSDKPSLRTRIGAMGAPQGDTKLYDAINYSLDYLEANSPKNRRRAVVLLTDGLDSTLPNVTGEGSQLPYAELRRRVQEFDGLFYAVMTDNYEEPQSPQDVQAATYDLAWDRMEELTKEAGGLYYEADKLEDVAGIYARVVEDLGTVYSISYLPTNKARDGRWRAVKVRLPRRPEAIARGRSGYYAK
ncbi:MAG: VWA domain-containing protein [Pyrinomonadaceae bacterium]